MCGIIISDGQWMMTTDLKKVNTHNLMDLLPTKKKINRQHRHRFADIEAITIYRNFDIFLDDIDTIRYGQYRLDISFGRYIVASLAEIRLGLRAKLRLRVIICAVLRVSCVEQLLPVVQYDC